MEKTNKFKISFEKEKALCYEKKKDTSKKNKKQGKSYSFFKEMRKRDDFPFYKNVRFELKKESIKTSIIKGINNKKISNIKIKENQIEKRKNKIRENNTTIRDYIIINLITTTIVSIFFQIKSNIFDLFYFKYSSKIILKIKGIGYNNILGNDFNNNNYPNEVYINRKKQDTITNIYYFNQSNNFVELIWNNKIIDCTSLFKECSNISEINLSNFDTSQVTSMESMFDGCSLLTLLDLSNLNTSNVGDMYYFLQNCSSLSSIDLSDLDTSNVRDLGNFFYGCSNLTSLDLSFFDTSQAELMDYMFYGCSNLTSLNLSNFNTSKVTQMNNMFEGCSNLTSLNLSNFDTSKVTLMNNMFEGCLSLSSLNLSNFNISQNTNMEDMFYNCVNLEYINLKNFSELIDFNKMFDNVPENIVICINENIAKEKIFPQLNNKSCYSIDCSDDWNSKQKKIINKTNECIESCSRSEQYQFEYNGKCYENCTYGLFYEENRYIENKCKCELDKCLLCPKVPLNKNLCLKCNINYYPKENDPLNLGNYINCYKDLKGYYLDNNLYKQCYYKCKACNVSGDYIDHNCTECNDNYTIRFKHNNFFNCYYNCSNEEKECYENLTEIIEKEFRENYDTSILDIGQDDFIKTEKMTITFTTFQNQKNNINKSVSTIDLGECEKKIRNESNLSSNETLYIKKIDIFQEEMKIPDVFYDVYYKSSGAKLIKLNLTICENCKIKIYIPINITDNIDKYNINSGYYHDICYTTTSEDGTDLTLKDRKINYYDKYNGVCQKNCEFTGYDSKTGVAICTCNFKESSSSIVDIRKFQRYKEFP